MGAAGEVVGGKLGGNRGGVAGGVVGGVAGGGSAGAGAGEGGTAQLASLDGATAITSGPVAGGVELSLACSGGEGDGAASTMAATAERSATVGTSGMPGSAVTARTSGAAAAGLLLTTFFDLAFGTGAAGVNLGGGEVGAGSGGGARSTRVNIVDAAATGGWPPVFGALGKGSAAAAGAGVSAARSSGRFGASIRRSCQGKTKPGRPTPWPFKARVNSTA